MDLIVGDADAGSRLDVLLASRIKELNRSSLEKFIHNGSVEVDNKTITKTGYKLKVGEQVKLNLDINRTITPQHIDLPVIYEDENCIVIDKPEGILTHSKGELNNEPTIATFIASKLEGLSGNRGGIVHRLDRATSGVIICAKNLKTLKLLQNQFSERKVIKEYTAVVRSGLSKQEAVIDAHIRRNLHRPKQFMVSSEGKSAQTYYKVVKQAKNYSQLLLKPATGRTHQLRVHLSYIGHPIIGDTLYGGERSDRVYLHAHTLTVRMPSGEVKTFTSSIPEEFKKKVT